MKHTGRWIAAIGLVLAIALFAFEGVGPIVQLLLAAGYGLVLAALFHALPMLINARAWQVLLVPTARTTFPMMAVSVWVRESVNGLLPVARIGGEIAAYRLLTRQGAARVPIAASLVVDMAVSLLSQGIFCLLGVALLIGVGGNSTIATQLVGGFVVLVALGAGFALLQGAGMFETLMRAADRLMAGRFAGLLGQSARIDRATRAIYRRRRRVLACFVWQFAGWVAGAGEIWLALYFLDHAVEPTHAVLIEALVQAISSVAFVVPGALGVQEGGFLLLGAALGIDGPTSLALAAARRLRDLVVFFPGLFVWQWLEAHAPKLTAEKVRETLERVRR